MKQSKKHLRVIATAATAAGYSVTRLNPADVGMLGTTIKISNTQDVFIVLSAKQTGFYPNTPAWFKAVCNSKHVSDKLLTSLGYSVVPSIFCAAQKFNDPSYVSRQLSRVKQYPVITKPETGFKGRGIKVVNQPQQLAAAVRPLLKQQKSFSIQPMLLADEYRILVVNGIVFAAHTKALPSVVGDGSSTVKQLLVSHSHLPQDAQFITAELARHQLRQHSILPAGQPLHTHITRKGGSVFYAKGDVPKEIETWALTLCKTLGTSTLGIDVFIPSDESQQQKYRIIEINASPGFTYLESRYNAPQLVTEIAHSIVSEYFASRD